MNPLEAFLMPVQDDERMRELARQLRGQQVAADFFAGSTVPGLQKMAQSEQQYIQNVAERQGVLREALERRKQYADENRLDRELRSEEGRLNRATQRALIGTVSDASAPGTTKNIGRYVNDNGEEMMIGYRSGVPVNLVTQQPLTADEMSGYRPQTSLSETSEVQAFEDLGSRSKDLNSLISNMESLDNLLQPYADAGIPFQQVPGFGFWEKMPAVGGFVRLSQDAFRKNPKAGTNYAAMRSVANTIAKLRSGLTQTNTELANIKGEAGTDALSDPKVFAAYYDRLKDAVESDLALIGATTSPRVLREYGKRTQGLNVFEHQFRRFQFPAGEMLGDELERQIGLTPEPSDDGWRIEPVDENE